VAINSGGSGPNQAVWEQSYVANEQTLVFAWTPNAAADGVDQYVIKWGNTQAGPFLTTFQISAAQALAAGYTWTIIPSSLPLSFPRDGTYWFTLVAIDAAGNTSGQATPVSKRVIRTGNKIKVRR
jgi:hypothetical protein